MSTALASPWVVITGSLHDRGGMDSANLALVRYLLGRGAEVHVVAHEIDASITDHPAARCHPVAKAFGSYFVAEFALSRRGRTVAAEVTRSHPQARVVVNGGNCDWCDINWVHFVHQAWQPRPRGAPPWFRIKEALSRRLALGRERRAIAGAAVVVANSRRTQHDLTQRLGVAAERTRLVYLEPASPAGPVGAAERAAARRWLQIPESSIALSFVGALGYDGRKGFDTLVRAWREWHARESPEACLIVAGGGRGDVMWQRQVQAAKLPGRIVFLGVTGRVAEVLAASDLLVSPVRYEPYGLNVHEAIRRGVPAMVSADAGVAERYPADCAALLLPDAEDAADLAARLSAWSSERAQWRLRFERFGAQLRNRSRDDVCAEFVEAVGGFAGAAMQS